MIVYKLVSARSGEYYVGHSINPSVRRSMHKHRMKLGNHHSKLVQERYNDGHDFSFKVLEEFSQDEYDDDPRCLLRAEQWHIDRAVKKGLCLNTSLLATSAGPKGQTNWRKGQLQFSKKEVLDIRRRASKGELITDLSAELGASIKTLGNVVHGRYGYACYPTDKNIDLRAFAGSRAGAFKPGHKSLNKGVTLLSRKQVMEIRRRVESGEFIQHLCTEYEVSDQTLSNAFHGQGPYAQFPVKKKRNLRNESGRIHEGTWKKGHKSIRKGVTILSQREIDAIRFRVDNGATFTSLGIKYDVSINTICNVFHRKGVYANK